MTEPVSRRRMLELSLAAPALAGPTTACDGGLIVAIIALIVEVIVIAVEAADKPETLPDVPVKLLDVAGGVVELENRSDTGQFVEIFVELLDRAGNQRNAGVVTRDGDLPFIAGNARTQLRLPIMESSVDGEHFLRVSVGGEVLESGLISLN